MQSSPVKICIVAMAPLDADMYACSRNSLYGRMRTGQRL